MMTLIDSLNVTLGSAFARGVAPWGVEEPVGDGDVSVSVEITPLETPTPTPTPSPTVVPTDGPVPSPSPSEGLASTGGDPTLLITALVVGGVLVALGATLVVVRRARQRRAQTHG
jgi:hypothetical protein